MIELDPRDTLPLALYRFRFEFDYESALREIEKARGLTADMVLEGHIGGIKFAQGDTDAALRHLRTADAGGTSVDAQATASSLADVFAALGRYEEARRHVDRALRLTDAATVGGLFTLLQKVRISHALGDLDAAHDALDRAWQAHGEQRPEAFPGTLARLGKKAEAERILASSEQRFQAGKLAYMTGALEGAFALGDLDQAFLWLDRAIDNREHWLVGHLRTSRSFDAVRADPRFARAMARLERIEASAGDAPGPLRDPLKPPDRP